MHSDVFYGQYLKTERNVWRKTLKFSAEFSCFREPELVDNTESFIIGLLFRNITLLRKPEIVKLKKLAQSSNNLTDYFEHRTAVIVENNLARVELVIKQHHIAMLTLVLNTDLPCYDFAKMLLIESIIRDEMKDIDELGLIIHQTLENPIRKEGIRHNLKEYIYDNQVTGFTKDGNVVSSKGNVNNGNFMLTAFLLDDRKLTFKQFLTFPSLTMIADDLAIVMERERNVYEYDGKIDFSKLYDLLKTEVEIIAAFNLSHVYGKLFERQIESKYKVSKGDFYRHLFASSQIVKELSMLMEFEENTRSSFNNVIVHCFCYLMVHYSLDDAIELATTYLNSDTTMRNYFYDEEFLFRFMEYFNNENNVMSLEMWLNISDVLDSDVDCV